MHTEAEIYDIIMHLHIKYILEYVAIVESEPKSMIYNNVGHSNKQMNELLISVN